MSQLNIRSLDIMRPNGIEGKLFYEEDQHTLG